MITLIVALARDYAIGRAGSLPWHLPDDLKRFKALTMGKPLLMGRKTAQSIGHALPGRRNLVLSRDAAVPFGERVGSLDEAIDLIGNAELMAIGGGQLYQEIYRAAWHLVDQMHLTWVDTIIPDADAFFPIQIDLQHWQETQREHHAVDIRHAHAFDFVDYRKLD